MTTEEFDKVIRSKIVSDDSILLWNKTKVWNKVVADQRKKRFAIFRYAAVFALFALAGLGYFLNAPKKVKSDVRESKNNEPISGMHRMKVAENIDIKRDVLAKRKPKWKEKKHDKPLEPISEINTEVVEEKIEKSQNTLKIESTQLVENKENLSIEKKGNTTNDPSILETNYVVTLVIPPKMEYKEYKDRKLIGRFFQEIKRYSNGEEFEWDRVNKKPVRLWAYLKNSLVPDSSVAR